MSETFDNKVDNIPNDQSSRKLTAKDARQHFLDEFAAGRQSCPNTESQP